MESNGRTNAFLGLGDSERIANSNMTEKKMVSSFVIGEKGAFSDCAQESFTLPSRYYTDSGIHDQEMSAIFQCSWLYVGHVSDLPDVGSYLTEEVAGQPILIVRSEDNALRAFFNVC